MKVRISTNLQSAFANRRLKQQSRAIDNEYKSLSSGDRIHEAAVDPSGLAISEGLKARSRSLSQARRNANDGISFFQLAEGNFNTLQSYAARLKELALQSASDTNSDNERLLLSKEFNVIKEDMKRITRGAVSNIYGTKDRGANFEIQIGVNEDPFQNRLKYSTAEIFDTNSYYGINSLNILSAEDARTTIGNIDKVINRLSGARAKIGSYQAKLRSAVNSLDDYKISTEATNSKIRDTDFAQAVSKKTSEEIKRATTTEMLKEANLRPNAIMDLV